MTLAATCAQATMATNGLRQWRAEAGRLIQIVTETCSAWVPARASHAGSRPTPSH
jgi:hypothetical protein